MLFASKDGGQGLVEYALILVLVAVVLIVLLALLGPAMGNVVSNLVANISSALARAGPGQRRSPTTRWGSCPTQTGGMRAASAGTG